MKVSLGKLLRHIAAWLRTAQSCCTPVHQYDTFSEKVSVACERMACLVSDLSNKCFGVVLGVDTKSYALVQIDCMGGGATIFLSVPPSEAERQMFLARFASSVLSMVPANILITTTGEKLVLRYARSQGFAATNGILLTVLRDLFELEVDKEIVCSVTRENGDSHEWHLLGENRDGENRDSHL